MLLATRRFSPACRLLPALLALWLTACGGGLGSDSDDDEITIDSIVQSSQTVNCTSAAYATASVSYEGDIEESDLSYAWTQTGGTSVTLVGTTNSTVYFTAPSSAGTVVLKLTVSGNDVSTSSSVSFTISGNSCTSS
jgi:hypothetical protein